MIYSLLGSNQHRMSVTNFRDYFVLKLYLEQKVNLFVKLVYAT